MTEGRENEGSRRICSRAVRQGNGRAFRWDGCMRGCAGKWELLAGDGCQFGGSGRT